jgi:hypothetical protein
MNRNSSVKKKEELDLIVQASRRSEQIRTIEASKCSPVDPGASPLEAIAIERRGREPTSSRLEFEAAKHRWKLGGRARPRRRGQMDGGGLGGAGRRWRAMRESTLWRGSGRLVEWRW